MIYQLIRHHHDLLKVWLQYWQVHSSHTLFCGGSNAQSYPRRGRSETGTDPLSGTRQLLERSVLIDPILEVADFEDDWAVGSHGAAQ